MEYQYSIGTSQIFQVMVYKGYLQVQTYMQKVSLASGERVTKVSEPKTEKKTKKRKHTVRVNKKRSCDQMFFFIFRSELPVSVYQESLAADKTACGKLSNLAPR